MPITNGMGPSLHDLLNAIAALVLTSVAVTYLSVRHDQRQIARRRAQRAHGKNRTSRV